MVAWLETFGRHRLDSFHSGVDSAALWNRIALLIEDAKSDRDGFLADLAAIVKHDRGGFATLARPVSCGRSTAAKRCASRARWC